MHIYKKFELILTQHASCMFADHAASFTKAIDLYKTN